MRSVYRQALRLTALAAALLAAGALGGCSGSGTKTSVVSGKVTYKGAPVTGGELKFYPEGGEPVLGTINADGTFNTMGVPPGHVTVTVDTEPLKGPKGAGGDYTKMARGREGFKPPETGGHTPVYVQIPHKYKDPKTSGLSVDVKQGKTENVELTLTD
ncbi:MAG TPA: hypothetical protein VFW33_22930 [Gemmataceae bacterium]|nr:hypothetical protein [Gemmataceae bacterium]